ncbi:class F sortase [Actinokineospora spheciospongiae]|uniref:class F sortase n=1 Tax=Actinokineospora spheciospongiae TaxID=909613 RepID=UPI000D8D1BBC|nr:class F sortase [Actinokineospora spheciospongiae]PWW62583.1 sortase family protein [Actinokineospora spheciospongiae]
MRKRAAVVLLALVAVTGCAPEPPVAPPATMPLPAPLPAPIAAVRVSPVGLEISAIGVLEREVVPLRLGAAGELEPPADFARVGWYAEGTAPGDVGPAVLAGHVDSRAGPAVFSRLRELEPGDRVTVHRSDGAAAVFTVDEVRRYPKDAFPTDAVYGPVPGAALRLITCGGEFDRARRSYEDNVVVFASARWAG